MLESANVAVAFPGDTEDFFGDIILAGLIAGKRKY
jgi:hypothetical protein